MIAREVVIRELVKHREHTHQLYGCKRTVSK